MKIPTYTREQDINPSALPQASPEAMTVGYRAAGQFGEQGVNLAAAVMRDEAYLERIRQRQKDEQALIDVTNAVSKFSDDERLFLTDLKANPHVGAYDEAVQWYDTSVQKYSESFAGKDPRIIKEFNSRVLARRESGLDAVAVVQAKSLADGKQTAFDNAYDSALKDAVLFANDDRRIQEILRDTFGGETVGVDGEKIRMRGSFDALHPKGTDELTRSRLKDDFLAAVVNQLMLTDPVKADKYLETYKADLGKSWITLKHNVEQAKFKNDVIADPYLAISKLDSGRYLFNPTDEANNRAFAIGRIEKKDRDTDKLAKQAREEAEQKVMDLIEKKDFVGAQELLGKYETARMLSPETRRTLREAINNPKDDLGDSTVYHNLEQLVLLNKATDADIMASSLTIPGKNKLLKLRKDDADVRKSYDYVSAMESAHKSIVTTGIMAALDPDQQDRFTSYKRAAEKNIQAGGDPWKFYDENLWKYRPGVPATIYGVPKSVDEVNAMRARLRADTAAGKIKAGKAGMEAEKLETALDFINKRDKVKANATAK